MDNQSDVEGQILSRYLKRSAIECYLLLEVRGFTNIECKGESKKKYLEKCYRFIMLDKKNKKPAEADHNNYTLSSLSISAFLVI